MTEPQKKTMKRIACQHVNGISLRLFKEGPDDGTGQKPQVVDGPPVILSGPNARGAGVGTPSGYGGGFSVTDVDPEYWAAWLAQNKGKNPLLDGGLIYDLDEKDAKAEEKNEERPQQE